MKQLLWNARLIMIERASADPSACAGWYSRLLGDETTAIASDGVLLIGGERRILFSPGPAKTVPSIVYGIDDAAQWSAYRKALAKLDVVTWVNVPKCVAAVVGSHAYAVADPDGRTVVFATQLASPSVQSTRPARLQHFVCASTQTPTMLSFYRDVLGFIESDRVIDATGELSSAFMRSDAEHHSFAVFRAPASGPDHHAYEVPDWNSIRDWADHCGELEIPLWWGPGRHGVGNNLFFMVEDPDGYKVEFSAELERMTSEQAFRTWPHGQRALNLWGNAWMRS